MPEPPDLARRRVLLTAALGFTLLDTRGKPAPPAVETVREWLNNWGGLGHVVTGQHSPTNATGSAFESTPWRAVPAGCVARAGKPPGEADPPPPAEDVILP